MQILSRINSQQKGSTLLEVLIAIVVFSFGMLGLLGFILNSLKMTSTSNYRSIAAEQFTAISETLNANPKLVSTYAAAASSNITSSCFNTGCSATQLPATEYGRWQQYIANHSGLPNAQSTICNDSTPADGTPTNWQCDGLGRPTVKICWDESRVSTAWSTTCFSAQI